MQLDQEFYRLGLRFDAAILASEVQRFTDEHWRAHSQGYPGNAALPLVAVDGDPNNDNVKGPMRPTPYLHQVPYLRQLLGALEVPIGRTRLMRIDGGAEATLHVDTNYYWLTRVRVHVPIITSPGVKFECGGRLVHMAAGEVWLFDTWRLHNVYDVPEPRVHLVVDTVGSPALWDLVAVAGDPEDGPGDTQFIGYEAAANEPVLMFERNNFPVVMSPWEQEALARWFFDDLARSPKIDRPAAASLRDAVDRLHVEWRALWAEYGTDADGFPKYREALQRFQTVLTSFEGRMKMANGMGAIEILRQAIVRPALSPELATTTRG